MKRSFVAAAAVMAMGTSTSLAEQSTCLSIESDLDRLACYDQEAGRDPAPVAIETSSKWNVEVNKSDFEDTTDVYMRLESDDPVACGRFGGPQNAVLFVRCRENTTSIYVAANCHLASGHGGYGNVDVRLDSEKAFTSAMDASTDNQALGLWSGGKAIPFLKKMLGKERMIVRFTPFSESATTATFSISGFDEAIKPLRESCKW